MVHRLRLFHFMLIVDDPTLAPGAAGAGGRRPDIMVHLSVRGVGGASCCWDPIRLDACL